MCSVPLAPLAVVRKIARRQPLRKAKMGRFILAWKLLFKVWFNGAFARKVGAWHERQKQLPGGGAEVVRAAESQVSVVAPAPAPQPVRSEALTLLAVLQREARLVDFLKEEISGYADAQIGAAVRDVHRDAGAALERMLALRPLLEGMEGSEIALPSRIDPAKIRLVGNVGATSPAKGKLTHGGWQVTKVELPTYTGSAEAAKVVAPAEVEG